LCFKLQTWRRN